MRPVLLGPILCLLGAACSKPPLPNTAGWGRLGQLEHGCASYRAPPDQIVYEQNPGAAERLLGHPGYDPVPAFNSTWVEKSPPAEWRQLSRALGLDPGIVFLHARRNPQNLRPRIVAVHLGPVDSGPDGVEQHFAVSVIVPSDRETLPHVVPRLTEYEPRMGLARIVYGLSFSSREYLRVYAGQPDPANDSRLTFKFETTDPDGHTVRRGVIEGWLSDDDRVALNTAAP